MLVEIPSRARIEGKRWWHNNSRRYRHQPGKSGSLDAADAMEYQLKPLMMVILAATTSEGARAANLQLN
jgi:hypothetical protein